MDATNHSTGGLPRSNGNRPKVRLRLAGLILTALLGALVIISVSRTTWLRVQDLDREFAGLNTESFYLGARLRGDIQRLNDTLLRYRLRGDAADYELFRFYTRELTEWLQRSSTNAPTPIERRFFDEAGAVYDNYLVESLNVLEANRARWSSSQARDFQVSYEKVQSQSQRLLALSDTFIEEQRIAFQTFLRESSGTLAMFERLLKLSLALLLTLAAALVVLVYRGMIAPLRHQLTESQAIIARQEKLASLGVLATGVAHEIRNPLTAIKLRLFSLKKSLPAGAADNEDAAVIGNEISRLERIVKDFLQFARPSEPELVDIPAQRIARDVHELLQPQLDKCAIDLKLEPSDTVWIRADTQQIKQVLINLIQNSADSIEREGIITLRVRRNAGPDRNGGGTVVLEVEDNGKGIPPEVQKRLFDPFFSTREGGTGLGLSIAARIVEKHGGSLRYQTELNRGTVFAVVLPQLNKDEVENPVD